MSSRFTEALGWCGSICGWQKKQGSVVCINSISECSAANGDTVVKGHVLNYPVNGNINRMGVKMQPCLTPEVVEILDDSFCPTVIHTLVFSCRAAIRWSMMSGIPLLLSAFQRAVQSMEYRPQLCSHDVSKTDMKRQAPDTRHQAPYIPDTCFVCVTIRRRHLDLTISWREDSGCFPSEMPETVVWNQMVLPSPKWWSTTTDRSDFTVPSPITSTHHTTYTLLWRH